MEARLIEAGTRSLFLALKGKRRGGKEGRTRGNSFYQQTRVEVGEVSTLGSVCFWVGCLPLLVTGVGKQVLSSVPWFRCCIC